MSTARSGEKKNHGAPATQLNRKTSASASPGATSQNSAELAQVTFLTVAEVATLMRVSKMTVYRLVHNGELNAVRVGRSFRVPEKAVHDYLKQAFIETA